MTEAESIQYMKDAATHSYLKKGQDVVDMNHKAIDADGKLVALALSGFVDDLGGGGELGGFLLRHGEGTDGGMGADIGALVALDAVLGHPGGDGNGHAALFIGGGAQLELARSHGL